MTKHYPANLVGEQFHQAAVYSCKVGDNVDVCIETGNPHDSQALVVKSRTDPPLTLGYIPTDSFVRGVYFEQGCSVAAAIAGVFPGRRGFHELKLLVSVIEAEPIIVPFEDSGTEWNDPEPPRAAPAPDPEPDPPAEGGQSRLLVALALGVAMMFLMVRCMA